MAERVLVSQLQYAKGQAVFQAAADLAMVPAPAYEAELAAAVRQGRCRAVVLGVERYCGPLYEALGQAGGPRGAIIARFGVGHDGIDKPQAARHNIVVINTPGVLDVSVAEQTIWLMGALARNIAALDASMRRGEFTGQVGVELRGKALGIVGLGNIGREVARIAHFGLGMRVVAFGRRSEEEMAKGLGLAKDDFLASIGIKRYLTRLEPVLRDVDVVSMHLSANAATAGFVNKQFLAMMKPGAMLVNTSRGSVLDEAALYDALAGGALAGAALDVFAQEPYAPVPGKDLRTLPNVVLTPHVGSNTGEANASMAEACVKNIRHFFAGRMDKLNRVSG